MREYYRNLSSSPEPVSSQADDVNLCDRATTNELTRWRDFKLNQRLIDLIKANCLIKRSVVSKVCTCENRNQKKTITYCYYNTFHAIQTRFLTGCCAICRFKISECVLESHMT